MAFNLPRCAELRSMINLETLAKVGNREHIVSLADARHASREVFKDQAANSCACIVVMADGLVNLVEFKRHNPAHSVLWAFGKL